jgi:hypothetical protein
MSRSRSGVPPYALSRQSADLAAVGTAQRVPARPTSTKDLRRDKLASGRPQDLADLDALGLSKD